MPQRDPLQILLAHDQWATGQILDACGGLTGEQYHRHFEMGPGSLHDTLTHIIGAMHAWTDTLTGREPGVRIETDGQRRTPQQLGLLLDEACQELAVEAERLPLDEMMTRRLRSGRVIQISRGAILTHVATHGMHHRAQCLNMLRQLGVSPLPPSSVTEWTISQGGNAIN